jgi:hypothetical protein
VTFSADTRDNVRRTPKRRSSNGNGNESDFTSPPGTGWTATGSVGISVVPPVSTPLPFFHDDFLLIGFSNRLPVSIRKPPAFQQHKQVDSSARPDSECLRLLLQPLDRTRCNTCTRSLFFSLRLLLHQLQALARSRPGRARLGCWKR